MKMAKASPRDIDAGYKLCGILDAISSGYYPLPENAEDVENLPTFFDQDDPAHLRHFYDLVHDLLDEAPGMPGRIIGGMCAVILYDKNQIVDPDADTLELHPRLQQALTAAEAEPALRDFAESCLSPERNGYAVPAHVRDDARRALGIPASETITDHSSFAPRTAGGA